MGLEFKRDMKKMIYISGKITGLPKDVYKKKFDDAEEMLKKGGWRVFNPTEDAWSSWFERLGKTYAETLWHDFYKLKDCDAIYMLDNFLESKGAKAEHAFAIAIGLEVIYDEELYRQGILRR